MMKKAITTFAFTSLFSLALFAGEGCCGTCKGGKNDADCKEKLKECTAKNCSSKSCKGHHKGKANTHRSNRDGNNNGTEVITTEEEVVIIGEAVPANTAVTPTKAAAK